MDLLTQGLLGGVMALAVARNREHRCAAVAGGFAGLLADADILIRSSADPLLTLEFHRHFSHALVFIPIGACIAYVLLWPWFRRRLPALHLYGYCLAGYSLSGVLDACTSYGTHLFWPFSETRIAWNIIAIIDPVFTLLLLLGVILAWRGYRSRIALLSLVLCGAYLGLGWLQQQRVQYHAAQLAQSRGHIMSQQIAKPTLGNLLLWRSVYVAQQRIYVDAIRMGVLGKVQIFPGDSLAQVSLAQDFPGLAQDSRLYRDLVRFTNFSDGWVAFDPQRSNVLGDVRYSMLPNSVNPLWGIEFDPDRVEQAVSLQFFRERDPAIRAAFVQMLLGTAP